MNRFLFIFFLLFVQNSFAQQNKVQNLPKYDKQKIHFGFSLGLNTCNFKMEKNANLYTFDSLYNIDNIRQGGFNLGIVTNLHLGNNFDLRFIPDLCFADRTLEYTFYINNVPARAPTQKKIESTFIQLPLYLKFKSDRIGNMRAYVLAGAQYNIDMVSQAKVENQDKQYVKLKRNDYGYTIGTGCDFYMEMFKLSLEVKMFNGLGNLLVEDKTIFAQSLESLRTKMFTFSLLFE